MTVYIWELREVSSDSPESLHRKYVVLAVFTEYTEFGQIVVKNPEAKTAEAHEANKQPGFSEILLKETRRNSTLKKLVSSSFQRCIPNSLHRDLKPGHL